MRAILAAAILMLSACTTAVTTEQLPLNNNPIQMNRDGPATRGPVRNLAAQPGEEIVTIRYWKIKKGTFPQFLEASKRGIWPFFEKIGARIVGMWQVIPPPDGKEASPDYDGSISPPAMPASNTGPPRAMPPQWAATAPTTPPFSKP
jgi:hypothetical protein